MGDVGMKSLCIEISRKVMLGKAVIKETRLPVDIIVGKVVIFSGRCFLYSWLPYLLKPLLHLHQRPQRTDYISQRGHRDHGAGI